MFVTIKRVVYKLSFDQFFCSKYFCCLSSFNQSSLCLSGTCKAPSPSSSLSPSAAAASWSVVDVTSFCRRPFRSTAAALHSCHSEAFLLLFVDFRKTATYSLHPSTLPFAATAEYSKWESWTIYILCMRPDQHKQRTFSLIWIYK